MWQRYLSSSHFSYGWDTERFAHDDHVIMSQYLLIVSVSISLSLIAQYYVGNIWKVTFLPEAGVTILIGITVGFFLHNIHNEHLEENDDEHFNPHVLGLSSKVFYFGFLSPIIFNAGYHMKRKLFYANFGAILGLTFIGTAISIVIVTVGMFALRHMQLVNLSLSLSLMECVAFAALISSTDPVSTLAVFTNFKVDPSLFYLVFGESMLNDAVAVTVFNVASSLVGLPSLTLEVIYFCMYKVLTCFFGSAFLGYLSGIITAYVFKVIDFDNHYVVIVSLILGLVYIPFYACELISMSGIVAALFTGIAARRYINKNIPIKCRKFASFVVQYVSNLAETASFCLLGLSVYSASYEQLIRSQMQRWISLVAWTVTLCFIGRAMSVYPALTLVNLYRRYKSHIFRNNNQTGDKETDLDLDSLHDSNQYSLSKSLLRKSEYFHSKYDTVTSINCDHSQTGVKSFAQPNHQSRSRQLPYYSMEKPIQAHHSNDTDEPPQIPMKFMHMVFHAGLRGAVAYALALVFPNNYGNRGFIASITMGVILITIFVQGGLTHFAIRFLHIDTDVDTESFVKRIIQSGDSVEDLHSQYLRQRSSYSDSMISPTRWSVDWVEKRFIYPLVLRKMKSRKARGRSDETIPLEFKRFAEVVNPLSDDAGDLSIEMTSAKRHQFHRFAAHQQELWEQSSGGGSVHYHSTRDSTVSDTADVAVFQHRHGKSGYGIDHHTVGYDKQFNHKMWRDVESERELTLGQRDMATKAFDAIERGDHTNCSWDEKTEEQEGYFKNALHRPLILLDHNFDENRISDTSDEFISYESSQHTKSDSSIASGNTHDGNDQVILTHSRSHDKFPLLPWNSRTEIKTVDSGPSLHVTRFSI